MRYLPFVCEDCSQAVLAQQGAVAGESVAFEGAASAEAAYDEVGTGVAALDAEEAAARGLTRHFDDGVDHFERLGEEFGAEEGGEEQQGVVGR